MIKSSVDCLTLTHAALTSPSEGTSSPFSSASGAHRAHALIGCFLCLPSLYCCSEAQLQTSARGRASGTAAAAAALVFLPHSFAAGY